MDYGWTVVGQFKLQKTPTSASPSPTYAGNLRFWLPPRDYNHLMQALISAAYPHSYHARRSDTIE